MKRALSAAVLLAAAAPTAGALDLSGSLGGEVEICRECSKAGDVFEYLSDPGSYEDEYAASVLESDATRASGVLELALAGSDARGVFPARNEFAHGPQLLRDRLGLEARYALAPRRSLRVREDLDVRRDLDGSLSYDSDLQHVAEAELRAESLAGSWSLRLRDRIANARVDGDSLDRYFDSDRNEAVLRLERNGGRGDRGVEGTLAHKGVPAGVTGGYRETGARTFGRRLGPAWFGDAEAESRRRVYDDASLHGAGGWTHELRATVGHDASGWGIELSEEATVARYDVPDEIYTKYVQNRAAVEARFALGGVLSAELEPAFETLRASGSTSPSNPATISSRTPPSWRGRASRRAWSSRCSWTTRSNVTTRTTRTSRSSRST